MALVNIDKLYLAIINKDEVGAGNLNFANPEYIPGIQKFQAKLKVNTGTLYEEGVLTDQNSTISSIEITLDLGHLSNEQYAKYLGHHVASSGGVYALESDSAPYVALLYEYTKSNNKKGWKIYYKGQLTEPDDAVKQKEGKIDYQNHSVSATFQPLKNNGLWKYTIEEDDLNCPQNVKDTFFNNVLIPTQDNGVPQVVVAPVDGATGVAANSNITLTFDKSMSLVSMDTASLFLVKADGTIVTTALTLDDTNKIATLKPSDALVAGQYTLVCTKNVKSVSNIPLANNVIVKFTV